MVRIGGRGSGVSRPWGQLWGGRRRRTRWVWLPAVDLFVSFELLGRKWPRATLAAAHYIAHSPKGNKANEHEAKSTLHQDGLERIRLLRAAGCPLAVNGDKPASIA